MDYRLRTLLAWLQKNDCRRIQVTLLMGVVGLMAASGFWMHFDMAGSVPSGVRIIVFGLGAVSLAAIAEGVWKLDD